MVIVINNFYWSYHYIDGAPSTHILTRVHDIPVLRTFQLIVVPDNFLQQQNWVTIFEFTINLII